MIVVVYAQQRLLGGENEVIVFASPDAEEAEDRRRQAEAAEEAKGRAFTDDPSRITFRLGALATGEWVGGFEPGANKLPWPEKAYPDYPAVEPPSR